MSLDRISHDDWMHLATEEYRRMLELLVGLDERDWRSPTDCTAWDVRETVAHCVLTPGHDGRLMADVVAEWADRHGQPYDLTLDGPAGGRYSRGSGGEQHRLDAVEFARIMAGRAPGDGLLTTTVPF